MAGRGAAGGLLDEGGLREQVERLAALERPAGSPGERAAAEHVAAELRARGARVELDEEPIHGTYWWPIGLPAAAAALAGLWRAVPAPAAAAIGAAGAAAVADDISGGAQWFRRRLLPRRTTVNVVAELGAPASEADRTVVLLAHHDAAHAGLVFHPRIARALWRRLPARVQRRARTSPPMLWGAVGGPALVALGALAGSALLRRLGGLLAAGYAAAMADIALRATVPGANDNATAVAVLVSVAGALAAEPPPPGTRVLLVSTGAEESLQEGMQGFVRRRLRHLEPARTEVICLETLGSPHLLALEGEGMLWMNEYPKDALRRVEAVARELGIWLWPGLRLRNASDGLIALRAGYPTVTLASVDGFKMPTDYHWGSDTPERVRYPTVADAARLALALVRGGSA